jgi:hypothetical protein
MDVKSRNASAGLDIKEIGSVSLGTTKNLESGTIRGTISLGYRAGFGINLIISSQDSFSAANTGLQINLDGSERLGLGLNRSLLLIKKFQQGGRLALPFRRLREGCRVVFDCLTIAEWSPHRY